jgi:hypothetical protein
MALKIDPQLTPQRLAPNIGRLFECSAQKILDLEKSRRSGSAAPVFTVNGKYASRGEICPRIWNQSKADNHIG